MDIPLPLVHGPLLYLYTLALTNRSASLPVSLLHFTPVAAELVYLVHFIVKPVEYKLYVYENHGAGYEIFNQVHGIAIIVSGVAYVVLASVALRRHRQTIVQEFSSTDKINLLWLSRGFVGYPMLWLPN